MRRILTLIIALFGTLLAFLALAGGAHAATAIEYGLIAALIATAG